MKIFKNFFFLKLAPLAGHMFQASKSDVLYCKDDDDDIENDGEDDTHAGHMFQAWKRC